MSASCIMGTKWLTARPGYKTMVFFIALLALVFWLASLILVELDAS
jgi:hypothetical protein